MSVFICYILLSINIKYLNISYYFDLIADFYEVYNYETEFYDSFFSKSVLLNKKELVNIILDFNLITKTDIINGNNETPLFYSACINNNAEISKILLNKGANPYYNNTDNCISPFLCFIDYNQLDIIINLLKTNYNPKNNCLNKKQNTYFGIKSGKGKYDFYYAIKENSFNTFEYFIKNNIFDINDEIDNLGLTPLLIASLNNDFEMIKYIILEGGNINYLSLDENNSLIYLLYNDSNFIKYDNNKLDEYERRIYQIVEFLIINGININKINLRNQTPLDFAINIKQYDVINLLKLYGAKRGCELRNEKCD